jgi:G3E family GTPase
VDQRKAKVIQSAISAINPDLTVFMTEFGAVNWNEYVAALAVGSEININSHVPTHSGTRQKETAQPSTSARPAVQIFDRPEDAGLHPHFHEGADALGYESFGLLFAGSGFELASLNSVFHRMTASASAFGEIIRAKGIFRTETGWKILELASGDISIQPIRPFQESKVSIIGKSLNREMIGTAFQQCRSDEQL